MDPLGARSQIVDVQTLHSWDHPLERGEEDEEGGTGSSGKASDQTDGPNCLQGALPSPFPFRDDINRKIVLL